MLMKVEAKWPGGQRGLMGSGGGVRKGRVKQYLGNMINQQRIHRYFRNSKEFIVQMTSIVKKVLIY